MIIILRHGHKMYTEAAGQYFKAVHHILHEGITMNCVMAYLIHGLQAFICQKPSLFAYPLHKLEYVFMCYPRSK